MRADEREVAFFKDILPNIKIFLKCLNQKDLFPNVCEIPYAMWNEEDKILIMQNLKKVGWKDAVNKKKGLDIDHVRLAFNWLATFHAIMYAFMDQYSGGRQRSKKDLDIFSLKFGWMMKEMQESESYEAMRKSGESQMKSLFATFETEGTDYVKHLEEFLENNVDIATTAIEMKENYDFSVETILHGDPWFNNMLFKYNKAMEVEDVIFIDFQLMAFGSPTIDLAYFLASSVTGEFMKKYKDHILTLYHTKFCHTVNALGSKLEWSYEDFLEDYKKSLLWGLQFALHTLPQILTENKDNVMDMEELLTKFNNKEMDETEMKEYMDKMYEKTKDCFSSTDGLVERLRFVLDECIEAGIF